MGPSPIRVLLVEDDAEAARVESKLLLRLGAEPTVARHLKVARRQLQEHEWDGVVLDVRLADGSGFELLEELRATRRTPVLIQTGLVDSSLPSRAFVLDAHLVYKPYEERVLRKFVDVLRRRKDRSHARVDAMVSVFARRRHLSDAEHWLLAEAMKGKS